MTRATAICALLTAVLLQLIKPSLDLGHILATTALLSGLGTALAIEVIFVVHGSLSRRHHAALGVVATIATLLVLARSGIASPVALFGVLLAHHYGRNGKRSEALAIGTLASVGILLVGIGATTGTAAVEHSVIAWSVGLAMIAAFAAWTGWTREQHASGIARRAEVRIRRREALLDEAYGAFETQRRPRLGQWSGKRIGRYHVEHIVAVGEHSEVYCANSDDGQRVAIKHILPGLPPSRIEEIVSRSATNAVAPGSVDIHEAGRLPDGGIFIVMELLAGGDLASHLREPWALTNTEILLLIDDLASTLGHAHDGGAFHGNITPENIIKDGNGRWRLTDFETSATTSREGTRLSCYAAPERDQETLTAAMDAYSVAAIAYRLLLRCPPIRDDEPFAFGSAYRSPSSPRSARPVRPTKLAPVHPDVDAVFALALAADASVRINCPLAFAEALRLAIEGCLPDWQRAHAEELLRVDPYATL